MAEIAQLHDIAVHDPDPADASTYKMHGDGRTKGSAPDDNDKPGRQPPVVRRVQGRDAFDELVSPRPSR